MPINTLANVRSLVGILLMAFLSKHADAKGEVDGDPDAAGAARLDALPIAPR